MEEGHFMKKFKRVLSAVLAVGLTLVSTACGGGKTNRSEQGENNDKEIVVSIPTYLTGENVGAIFFKPQVERFNKKYEGKYKINLESITQDNYGEKIKQLAIQKKLPVLVHAPGSGVIDDQWFRSVIVANDMAYDLTEWAKTAKAKDLWFENSVSYSTFNGKLLVQPNLMIKPIGMFYNSSMYTPEKPIRDMTMDEFISSLGNNKIAFQTAENSWASVLLLTALVAQEEGGADLINNAIEEKLWDYNQPQIVKALEKLKNIFVSNGASNSIGAAYADAANAFMSKNAAVICNGTWMQGDFQAESSDKWSNGFVGDEARSALYPGNIAISNDKGYGKFWISNNASEQEKELAKAFLEFIDSPEEVEALILEEGGVAPKLEYSKEFLAKQKENKIIYDLVEQIDKDTTYVENISVVMPSSIAESEFSKLLPKLLDGSISAEEMAKTLTEKAQQIKDK